MIKIVASAAVVLSLASPALAQMAFQVDYVSTVTVDGVILNSETGVHTFLPDGRQRIDREVNGESTSEIYLPATASAGAERIEINHALGFVRRGPAAMMTGRSTVFMERPLGRETRFGPSEPAPSEGIDEESLGTRAFGPLLLHGYRVAFPDGVVREGWRYVFPNGLDHIELEYSMRGVSPDGTEAETGKRIVESGRVSVSPTTFDNPIPNGMRVQDLWQRQVR